MSSINYLKDFDKKQLWRFFIDGRFHKKYNGWVEYENREKGSVQAVMNGFALMMDNLHKPRKGLNSSYILNLHKTCMFNVQTNNLKSTPGDIRYLENGMPFFVKTTTLEHIEEVLEMRINDKTIVFNDPELRKTANELNPKNVFELLQKKGKLIYRPWYPNIDIETQKSLNGEKSVIEFYDAKHIIQKSIAQKLHNIVKKYNSSMEIAKNNEEKLTSIALLVRELELLHPFSDGNCRTFAGVLLNQLLIYNDFYPTILKNPNLDGEYSLKQWTEEIRTGMEYTKVLLKNPEAEVFNFSIKDMDKKYQNEFLEISKDFIKKIDSYEEVFLTPKKLSVYTKGKWFNYEPNLRFTGVGNSSGNLSILTNTDKMKKDNKSISKEIDRLISNGVRAIILDDFSYIINHTIPIYLVEDVDTAYEEIAHNVRIKADPKTILITGTEGKTGTKIQTNHVFSSQTQSHAILNSANAKIPVLRTLANIKESHEYEIVEFSVDANHEKTIKGAKLVNPDICFFTNIGKEHMHNHKNLGGVIEAKSSVVLGIRDGGYCLVNSTISCFEEFKETLLSKNKTIKILTYGDTKDNDAYLISSNFDNEKLYWNIKAKIQNIEINYTLPLIQSHSPIMSIGILLLAKICDLDLNIAAKSFANLEPYESMGLVHKLKIDSNNVLFYDQSRRASISGVRSAFNDLKNLNPKGKIVALIGSISSVNENQWTIEYQKELGKLISNSKIEKLYTTGSNMQYTHETLENKDCLILHSDNYEKLYKYVRSDLKEGDLLFVMGYMRLNLDIFSDLIIKDKEKTPFDEKIHSFNLENKELENYKNIVVQSQLERGVPPYIISNYLNSNEDYVFNIRNQNFRYYDLCGNFLYSFISKIKNIFENKYEFDCINEKLLKNDNLIYNQDFCNRWFNLPNNSRKDKKQLFGTFHKLEKNICLFLIIGSSNIHVGLGKVLKNELINLSTKDQEEILQYFNFDNNIKLTSRTWGKKWLTYDFGTFNNLTNAKIYNSFITFENKPEFLTLMNAISRKNQ